MPLLKTILIVDDSAVSRKALIEMLREDYTVLEAKSGTQALKMLYKHRADITAIMLDLVMPVMDGYDLLTLLQEDTRYNNLPKLVTTGNGGTDNERRALALGAWDFVSKPYDKEIILFRLKNAIDRSQLSALKQLKYLSEYDTLTGIYNKAKFFDATRKMLNANSGEKFAFLRFDVDRFQLINSFFGTAEGDKLLKYIADHMSQDARKCEKSTYGRIESDIVGLCVTYDKDMVEALVRESKKTLAKFNLNYDIVPSIGIYIIDDPTVSVEEMYNRATLAAKTCKGNYVDFYAYYTESMSSALAAEQAITNEMNFALENGQFQIYLQPQYNIHTNSPCGAEALVRWFHPQKGMLSPGVFIPVFERNGFISKLDYYVWEQACKCLHAWKLKGLVPYPISVNISRVNIYNPNLVSLLLELVKRYELEPSLLKLELTESAYTDSPIAMKKIMSQLQKLGFTIMMDDFGSGYSSLSMLKDILVDVLKIDMTFLSKTEIPGRGENIIASVIRMAKWLSIPVIAEGAETAEQVDFLRSVGCDYVQGYYFAHPMPVAEYEKLCLSGLPSGILGVEQKQSGYQYDNLFAFNDEVKSLFSNALQPAAIYEFADDKIEIIRVNEAYYSLLGHDDMLAKSANVLSLVDADYRLLVLNAFRSCVSCGTSNCEYTRIRPNANPLWLHTTLSYTSTVGNKHIIIGEITDITLHKAVDYEIQKYKNSWLDRKQSTLTALIVDDVKINRTILKKILQDKFLFLEAENGEQAIKVLRATKNRVDLIFLDVSMPVMDGKEFLLYKKNLPELDSIPVIMITGDDSGELQSSTFALGASDYIIKPFIPAVVTRRVSNVLEANQRFKDMVREYNAMSAQVKTDLATGLMSKIGAQEKISSYFESHKELGVLAILDMDSFKNINELFGHDYGDEMICAVADLLKLNFRKEDVVARISEDSFLIFIGELDNPKPAIDKLHGIINDVNRIKVSKENVNLTCSIGAAVSDEEFHSFDALYKNADKALYRAKCKGGNALALYNDDAQNGSVVQWITDAESVLNTINDSIYACDRDNYNMIYANDGLCRLMGVSQEDLKGKKCYEVLMHKTCPCDFCSVPEMVEGKTYTRFFHMPNSSNVFLMHGENISRNGSRIHLEVGIDVTEVENKNLFCSEVKGFEGK